MSFVPWQSGIQYDSDYVKSVAYGRIGVGQETIKKEQFQPQWYRDCSQVEATEGTVSVLIHLGCHNKIVKAGSSVNNKHTPHSSEECKVQDQRDWQGQCLAKGLFLIEGNFLLCPPLMMGEQ